jgi:hypothetical protein
MIHEYTCVSISLDGSYIYTIHTLLSIVPQIAASFSLSLSPNAETMGLISYIDIKAKCRHLKKFTCKGTLRQVFIRVYRLEIQSVMLVFFRPSFVNCCSSNLLSGSTMPLPCVNKYTVYTYTVCKGGCGVLGLRHINSCREVP